MTDNGLMVIIFIMILLLILVASPGQSCLPIVVLALVGLVKMKNKVNPDDSDSDSDLDDEPESEHSTEVTPKVERLEDAPKKKDKKFVINKKYDNSNLIKQMLHNHNYAPKSVNKYTNEGYIATDGDTLLADRMKAVSMKNKEAIHHRTRFNSDNFRQYFQEELDEQEKKIWWEHDALDAHM